MKVIMEKSHQNMQWKSMKVECMKGEGGHVKLMDALIVM